MTVSGAGATVSPWTVGQCIWHPACTRCAGFVDDAEAALLFADVIQFTLCWNGVLEWRAIQSKPPVPLPAGQAVVT